MAEYTYEQFKNMTVVQLREIVPTLPDQAPLEGFSTMHKDHLLPLMCKVLGIHIHQAAVGTAKSKMKATIHQLKAKRDKLIAEGKTDQLSMVQHQIHVLKRKLRRMADQAEKSAAAAALAARAPAAGPAKA
jgi:hypothetical protein